MSVNTTKRDIIHEMADVLQILGDDYTLTGVECDPGDSAIRITKRNSEKTLYAIAYSDPDYTGIILYDEHDELISQHIYYNGSFHDLTPEQLADHITETL